MNSSLSRWLKPGAIDISHSPAGLASLQLQGAFGSAQFFLQGAHLTRFHPRSQNEMLFVSAQSHFAPGKAIRGGIPVIFPWFGPREGHPESPMHGLVRTRDWELTDIKVPDNGSASVTFQMQSSPETLVLWPHAFALKLHFTLGETLHIAWEVSNTGSTPFVFEQALHPYFPVADVHHARVHGLHHCRFLDKTAGPELQTDLHENVRFTRETDRLYFDTEAPLVLEDPAAKQRLLISKKGSRSSVVWNPWIAKAAALADLADDEWQKFVCVEQVNAKHNAITLAPGEQHRMEAEFRSEIIA
jgi:glucose-6-phosphate 1-epimerase